MRLALSLLIVVLSPLLGAQDKTPYVVLVSLDGFRYDYAQRDQSKNFLEIARTGAKAQALIPSFPAVTFPNHISIATGLYPGHHGIVANTFWDPERNSQYSMARSATDSTWYRANPIWVAAEQQHVKTATMFWPTSDAEINGVRPSYWALYDGKVPDTERIRRVLEWLHLPADRRPHLVTLYFSDADDAGHHFGPDSPELHQTVARLDDLIGQLWQGLKATGLPINLILVSDHGMEQMKGVVNISDGCDLSKVRVVGEGAMSLIYAPDPALREQIYGCLRKESRNEIKGMLGAPDANDAHSPAFDVYRLSETPRRWHYTNPRAGDLIVLAREPVELSTTPRDKPLDQGRHGLDVTQFPNMRGIFYAVGPTIRPGVTIPQFENVNIYPFIAQILNLKIPAGLDGSPKVLNKILVKR